MKMQTKSSNNHRMVELKARTKDHEKLRKKLSELGSKHVGTFHQIDVYFEVPEGRLKLREVEDSNNAELIYYERENIAGPKQDEAFLLKVQGLSPFLLDLCEFDEVFTSEQARSYKNDPECKLFLRVIEHYGIEPERILHIGDSSADVMGAHRVGIKTCWLNRDGRSWRYSIEPDYTVGSLSEVVSIL